MLFWRYYGESENSINQMPVKNTSYTVIVLVANCSLWRLSDPVHREGNNMHGILYNDKPLAEKNESKSMSQVLSVSYYY